MIMPGPGRYASFIKETIVLPKCPQMCIPGKGQLIAYQSKPWSKSKIGVAYLPAQPMCVALYLCDLLESAQTSPIDTAIYSIRWGHSMASLPFPTDHPIVKSTYEGCKIILAKPRQLKAPIQLHMLRQLVDMHGHSTTSPAELRLLFIVLVGYSVCLRLSEILAIQLKHIEIVSHGMSIFVPRRKNDQFRSGKYDSYSQIGQIHISGGYYSVAVPNVT
jgi:hypothetical protein